MVPDSGTVRMQKNKVSCGPFVTLNKSFNVRLPALILALKIGCDDWFSMTVPLHSKHWSPVQPDVPLRAEMVKLRTSMNSVPVDTP